jgi:hypothetical protein
MDEALGVAAVVPTEDLANLTLEVVGCATGFRHITGAELPAALSTKDIVPHYQGMEGR